MRRRQHERGPGVVAVTGAASGLGRALVQRLADRDDLQGLVGLDTATSRVDGVVWRIADVTDERFGACLAGVGTLAHLATSYEVGGGAARSALNVDGTARVLAAAKQAGLRRVVLCTSAEVYGVHADNPVPVLDAAPLRATPEPGSVVADHLAVEQLAVAARTDGLEVTVLRPASLAGLGAAFAGAQLRQLAAQQLLAVRGIEPVWQLCHVQDLVAALELAVLGVVSGSLGVACEGAMNQQVVERVATKRRVELPAALAVSTAQRLHRLGLSSGGPRELEHVLGPLVLGCDGLRRAGWTPTWTNEDALRAHLADRGDGRGAAYTAAGATVALLGTAALVRQARRRRRL